MYWFEVKCNHFCPGFELCSPCPSQATPEHFVYMCVCRGGLDFVIVCVFACVFVFMHLCECTFVAFLCMCVRLPVCECVFAFMSLWVCVCVFVFVYVCVFVYVVV